MKQKQSLMLTTALIKALTPAQAKILHALGLVFDDLSPCCTDRVVQFLISLKWKGIPNNPLGEKLTKHSFTPANTHSTGSLSGCSSQKWKMGTVPYFVHMWN